MTEENKSVKNFPNLRFPGFEGEWEIRCLEDFIDVISGIALKSDEIVEFETGIPILRGINITEGFIRHSKEIDRFYPKIVNEKLEKFILKINDLVIGMDGSKVGKNVALIDEKNIDSILIQRVARIRALSSANIHFIFQKIFSSEFIKYVDLVNTSSGIPHISLQQIKDFKTSFPLNILEQEKIASFLSLLDSRIQTQKKIIEQLETLMKASRENIFSQKLRFKNEHGSDFPAWERKKIKEILTIGSGKDYKHLNDGDIPVYGTGGIITFVDSFLYDGETVCIGRKGTIDKPLYFNGKIWTVDTLFYTHSFNNSVPKFVFNIFQNINWKEYNEASGVPSLSKNTIEKIEISIPYLKEQYKITNFLSSIQEKRETEKQILEKLELQKKFLLANLFV